jgi:endonuclease YncB( thermonuclease family)
VPSINELLINKGLAWVYDYYCKKPICPEWKQLEESAKLNKIGLWVQPSPTPPWEYRRKKQKKSNMFVNTVQ